MPNPTSQVVMCRMSFSTQDLTQKASFIGHTPLIAATGMVTARLIFLTRTTLHGRDCLQDTPITLNRPWRVSVSAMPHTYIWGLRTSKRNTHQDQAPVRNVVSQSQPSLFPWNDILWMDRECAWQVTNLRGNNDIKPSQIPVVIWWGSCRSHRLILMPLNLDSAMWWMLDPCSHSPFLLQYLVRDFSSDHLRTSI